MDRPTTIPLRIGEWRLDSQLGQLSRGARVERLEARTLRLLQYLANRAGDTVSMDDLLENVWSGVVVTQDSVYQAITSLRRLLGDDAKNPRYIATVPRLGYRLVAHVSPWEETQPAIESPQRRGRRKSWAIAAAIVLVTAAAAIWLWLAQPAAGRRSVAVMPFLDLTTQEMKEEYFADGLTEELIHRLSRLPGFTVPSPTAVYYFKDRRLTVADIAAQLRVRYLLDGSLRASGDQLRISARLVRASDGVVIWSENYDRPKTDRVMIQDDIASEVASALSASVE